tara:strand:+ start:523 stop:873 length:351 start_codon:yes stop_codon:yes gene_type:complete
MKLVNEFLKNFLIGGITIGLYSILVKYYSPALAGHLSGALPLVFSFVVISTFLNKDRKTAVKVAYYGIRGVLFWLVYVFIVYFLLQNNYSLTHSILTALASFFLLNALLYNFLVND